MSDQLCRGPELETWLRFLRAHAAVTRTFNTELLDKHGLTLTDFEVLLHLADAPNGARRRVDLVRHLLLTPSGITRLLDGLEREGLVCKRACESDARVTYAVLTDAGRDKLQEAAETHVAGIRALFSERFTAEELDTLSVLLERLPASDVACGLEGGDGI